MKKRLLSALLAVSMMLSLFPTSAFAAASRMGEAYSSGTSTETYNLSDRNLNGVLTIEATAANTYSVTKGTNAAETVNASEIIITGTAPSGFALTVDGTDAAANVTLNNATVDNTAASGKPGMTVKGTVTLTLKGKNTLSGGNNCAGLQKSDDGNTLTITGDGDLSATGSSFSAGIGGGYGASSGNIIFQGSGRIEAAGSSGIGSGCSPYSYPDGHDISIISGTINATTTNTSGAAIGGGGYTCSGYKIYISGGNVTASGGYTGIGGGYGSGNIYISGSDTIVNATGNTAGISGRYSGTIEITGGDVTATGGNVGIGAYENAGSITISGGSVKATGTQSVGIGTDHGDASNITVSGGSVKVLSSLSGIGSYFGTASVTIKGDAKVAIYRNQAISGYVYVGSMRNPPETDIKTRSLYGSSAGLDTGYVYCYQSVQSSIPETFTSPNVALPIYSIKVNNTALNGYTARYGLTTNNATFTYDPATKKLSSTASLNENLTIEVDNNNTYASNNDLKGEVAVELTNTNQNESGEYTTGTLTTTGAGNVTVKNNFSYNVTLDDKNITPADQPNDYTKATEGKKLVITPVHNYNLTVTNGKAYADEAHTRELRTAKNGTGYRTVAGCTVYLKGIAPNDGKFYKFTGWTATTPAGLTVADTAAADTSFTMPDNAAALTANYVEAYTVTVDDQLLKDDRGNTLYFAKGDTVRIESTTPATDDGTHPNALFANWSGPDDVKFENNENAATTFTMPDHDVSVETVKKYKVAVTGGTAYTDDANAAAAVIYAKENDTVHLQYTASGPFKKWNCTNGTITINPEGAQPGQASFSMPGQPVAVSAEVGLTPLTPMTKIYRILVQLPEGETFADGSTPVTVTVTDTPTGAETPDDTNTPSAQTADISSPVFAKAGQTVTLKFDLSSLPVGSEKTFGEWKVVSLAPAQPDNTDGTDTTADGDTGSIATTPVTVKNSGSATDASFVMPAAPVVVTFTLNTNTLPTPDGPADGSEPSIAGGIVAGTLIGGATYLVGTDFWLNCLYGFLPIDRVQLAEALWNKADCPAPVSAELYPDIDEDDTDAQAAARWCVEQGLMKDYSGTDKDGSEEVTFKPCGYVFRPQAIKAWYDLEKLLNEQQ